MRSMIKGLAICAALAALPVQHASAYMISIHDNGGIGIANLAAADALIAAGAASLFATGTASIIEFDDLGDGTTGNFAINNAWPGGASSSFAAHITGNILTGAGTFTFGLNHDDGARLLIDGILVAVADGVLDNRDTIGSITLAAGLHTVDIVMFENFGGASLEFYEVLASGALRLVPSVPEPSTILLLGLGLTLAGFRLRKRLGA